MGKRGPKPQNLKGRTFGVVTAVEMYPHVGDGCGPRWLVRCSRGGEYVAYATNLRNRPPKTHRSCCGVK